MENSTSPRKVLLIVDGTAIPKLVKVELQIGDALYEYNRVPANRITQAFLRESYSIPTMNFHYADLEVAGLI